MSDGEKIGLIFAVLVVFSVMKSCTDKLASPNSRPSTVQPMQSAPKRMEAPNSPIQLVEQLEATKKQHEREALEERKQALLEQYNELQLRLEGNQ